MQNKHRESQTAWNNLLKPSIIMAAPFTGKAVAGPSRTPKPRNPQAPEAKTDNSKSISLGNTSSLKNMQRNGMQ